MRGEKGHRGEEMDERGAIEVGHFVGVPDWEK